MNEEEFFNQGILIVRGKNLPGTYTIDKLYNIFLERIKSEYQLIPYQKD